MNTVLDAKTPSIYDGRLEKLIDEVAYWAHRQGYAEAAMRAPYPPKEAFIDQQEATEKLADLDKQIRHVIRSELDREFKKVVARFVETPRKTGDSLSDHFERFAGDDQEIWDRVAYLAGPDEGVHGMSAGEFLNSFKFKKAECAKALLRRARRAR